VAVTAANLEKGGTPITMKTITKSVFGSPGRSGMSAPALVTLAIVALVVLALSATSAQSAERHDGNTMGLSGGKTWVKLDKGTATALSDAGAPGRPLGRSFHAGPTSLGEESLSSRIFLPTVHATRALRSTPCPL
jgi:hypothetical protein